MRNPPANHEDTEPARRPWPMLNDPRAPALRDRILQMFERRGRDFHIGDIAHAMPNFAWGMGLMDAAMGVAGPARGRQTDDELNNILSKIPTPTYLPAGKGFTRDFELPIVVDVPPDEYLACASCSDPLLLSSAYRTQDDRVWALRCGHMLDEKCLDKLSIPADDEAANMPILGVEPPHKKRRSKRKPTKRKDEYEWECPVCSRKHWSEREGDETWVQAEHDGALQMYA